jgi:hypothetical protein
VEDSAGPDVEGLLRERERERERARARVTETETQRERESMDLGDCVEVVGRGECKSQSCNGVTRWSHVMS